jgi:hypothetical protein
MMKRLERPDENRDALGARRGDGPAPREHGHGVRTPMHWTGDRNGGFSRADFAQLYAPPLMDPSTATTP